MKKYFTVKHELHKKVWHLPEVFWFGVFLRLENYANIFSFELMPFEKLNYVNEQRLTGNRDG